MHPLIERIEKLSRLAAISQRMDELHEQIESYANQLSEGADLSMDYLRVCHLEMVELMREQEQLTGVPSASLEAAIMLATPRDSDTIH